MGQLLKRLTAGEDLSNTKLGRMLMSTRDAGAARRAANAPASPAVAPASVVETPAPEQAVPMGGETSIWEAGSPSASPAPALHVADGGADFSSIFRKKRGTDIASIRI